MKGVRLSDWEIGELVYYRDSGWCWRSLAAYYDLCERSVKRTYEREKGRSHNRGAASVSEVVNG